MASIEEIMRKLERDRARATLEKTFSVSLAEEYWSVQPNQDACEKCQEFSKKQHTEKPERLHPNCKCKISKKYAGHYYVVGMRKLDSMQSISLHKRPEMTWLPPSLPPKPRVYRDPYHSQYKLDEYDSIFYIQHHHFIRDDGVNFGFFMDGIHSEDDRLDEYARMSTKFKAKYIEAARDKVKNNFTEKSYNLAINNCQSFINNVIQVANSLALSNNESLYIED
ncbi:hypothetical protein [Bilophila wadsworthia]|uniref:hypothetical protein n=1 Tax=Bilophila wadsworthia TaxID=35833 RepID=UPI00266D5C2B|nr:hypothetical protein [Bilophila wadsworthia]